jgi:Flp pilus assembly pilin Flp
MWSGCMKLIFGLQRLMAREDGQDLVEYALVICMIGIAATASSSQFYNLITTVFNNIAARVTSLA